MIVYIRFASPVTVASNEMEYWSSLRSTTSEILKNTKVIDKGPDGVVLQYRAGDIAWDVEVPRANIRQITRQPVKVETKK